MQTRTFGPTGRQVSDIGFGAWAIGGNWGHVEAFEAKAALHAALDAGMTFIDTADVYGDGRSERLIAEVLKARGGVRPFVATKAGRRLPQQVTAGYTAENLAAWIDRSLENLQVDTLDLVQLHCPPTDLYDRPEVFDMLDRLVAAGKIRHYGVSVEKVEEALKAIAYPGVASVQIIFNIFRQKPIEAFFAAAKARQVAVIARVPLASGLLTGKFRPDTRFDASDHRQFNRHGEAFDVGETFSGVDYDKGLAAVEKIRPLVGDDRTMAQFALRWILMFDAVTVAIPGAKTPDQARANAAAADLPPLSDEVMARLKAVYDEDIRPAVHGRWKRSGAAAPSEPKHADRVHKIGAITPPSRPDCRVLRQSGAIKRHYCTACPKGGSSRRSSMGIVVDLARSSVTFKDPLLLYQALDFRNNQVEFDMHAFTIRFGIGFDPDPKRGIGGSPDDYEFWQIGIVQNVIYQRLVLHFEHGHSFQFDWDNPVLDVLPNTFSAPYFGDPVFSATRAGQRPVTRVAVSKDGYGELLSPVSRSGVSTNNLPDALDLWDQPAGGSRLKLKDNSMIHHMEKAIGFQSWLVAKSGTRMEILAHVPPFTLMFWLTTDTKGFEKTYSFDTPPYKYGIYGRDGLVKGKVATRVEQIGASPSIQPKLANNGRAPVLGGVLANDRAQHFMSNYGLNP